MDGSVQMSFTASCRGCRPPVTVSESSGSRSYPQHNACKLSIWGWLRSTVSSMILDATVLVNVVASEAQPDKVVFGLTGSHHR